MSPHVRESGLDVELLEGCAPEESPGICDSSSVDHSVQLFLDVLHKTLCNQPIQVEVNSNLSMLSIPSTLSPTRRKLLWYV